MILQPGTGPRPGQHYLPSTPATVMWGLLPNGAIPPALRIASGDVVTVDTLSHQGLLGRDPIAWFGARGVDAAEVLDDAVDVAAEVPRADGVGPHLVTGPIAVEGCEPGSQLAVEVLGMQLRVPYAVTTRDPRVRRVDDAHDGIRPYLGVMGVATATGGLVSSTPVDAHGGNIEVEQLGAGATLYLPVQVDGANFYCGSPHFAPGLEGSLRVELRLTRLDGDQSADPGWFWRNSGPEAGPAAR